LSVAVNPGFVPTLLALPSLDGAQNTEESWVLAASFFIDQVMRGLSAANFGDLCDFELKNLTSAHAV
jgi:hypothetical protein